MPEFNIIGEEEKPVEEINDPKTKAVYDKAVEQQESKEIKKQALEDMGYEQEPEPSETWPIEMFQEGFNGLGIALKCDGLKEKSQDTERMKKYSKYMSILFPLNISGRVMAAFMLFVMLIADISPCIAAWQAKSEKHDDQQREPAAKPSDSSLPSDVLVLENA
jgi:hypothetical protein